jgi:hypothetical protein
MRLAGKFDAPAWLHHLELYLSVNYLRFTKHVAYEVTSHLQRTGEHVE